MILKGTLLLLLVVAANASRNTYLVTAPKRITPGQPYTVTVNILNSTDEVDVEVSIQKSWYNNSQYVKVPVQSVTRPFQKGMPDTVTLTVPQVSAVSSYILRVEGTKGLVFEREETLIIASKTISVFIQTDKALYKPGQRVHFRVFAVYPDLKIYNGPVDVDIYDPNRNRIRRFMSISELSGVSERDMLLSDQPVLGDWRIEVSVPEFVTLRESMTFAVQRYELPKFEVKVELPPFALINDENLSGTINANYTYGKGVKGMAEVRVYVGAIRNYCGNLAPSVHKSFPIDGSAEFSVPVAEIKKLQSYLNQQTITVVADVKEELTGKTLNGSSKVTYYTRPYKISFLKSSPNNFKPGLPYRAYVKVQEQDGRPVSDVRAGVQVYTCVNYQRTTAYQSRYECSTFTGTYELPVLNLALPADGVIPVDVEIPDNVTQVRMRAYYREESASLTVYESQSPSDTFIQARLVTLDLKAGDEATFKIQATSAPGDIFYQISSRGATVDMGVVDRDNDEEATTLTLRVPITPTMSPTANFLVYFVKLDGEIIADSISFNVEGIFENEVSIGFSEETKAPHSNTTVNVNADLNSIVYLLAVDQSVLLLKSGNDITTDKVKNELRSYDTSAPSVDFATWRFPVPTSGTNAQQIFQRAQVVVLTDATLYGGHRRRMFDSRQRSYQMRFNSAPGEAGPPAFSVESDVAYDSPPMDISSGGSGQVKAVERVREIFPETWLWTNTTISSESGESLQITVPDTITSWIASAFAVNPNSGLGVASNTAKLNVFKSFFVSLNLPLSVVKGEHVVLQANVFNYMDSDQQVTVTLDSNEGFMSIVTGPNGAEDSSSETQIQTISVASGKAKAVFFPIAPTSIGMVDIVVKAQTPIASDAVKRQLTVKPEGIRKEQNIPVVVDLTSDKSFRETKTISAPPGLVEGSERVRVSVTGDLLGSSINNMDDLLALPTGCGEQNMLRFAPNIYIADYLMATKQMSRELEAKIKTYLEIGYQRQLSYQRQDGSFSTFGERDEAGSVWLTSFVVKSFYQAQRYIYIDNSTVDSALNWLLAKQKTSGDFDEPGRVIDKQLQGTNGSGPALTAYVLLALAEVKDHNGTRVPASRLEQAKMNATSYLEGFSDDFNKMDVYSLAVTSYALARVDQKKKKAKKAFYQLKKKGVKEGKSLTHWDVNEEKKKNKKMEVESIDILTTAYGLMNFVARDKFSPGKMIMHWLTSQRSPRGGFKSSQDTCVALEALTKFVVDAQPNNYDITITISAGDVTKTVEVNNANVLVVQIVDLMSIPSELTITADGTGMASVELGMFYNVMSKDDPNDVFDVSTVLLDDNINGFTLMTCAKHLVEGSNGMCVASIQIPSGFQADLSSVGNIVGLKRLEQEGQKVVAYLDEVGTSSTCITMACSRTHMVAKNKETYISVMDYYNPDDNAIVSYHPRKLRKSNICSICRDCASCGDKVA